MTYSILARDAETGIFGGAAATGSLCVGGWVLRGRLGAGMSASQGTAPSTLWGDEVLDRMAAGETAESAVAATVSPDPGRDHRQLAALDANGGTGAFTGAQSVPAAGCRAAPGAIVTGNLLTSEAVLEAALSAFLDSDAPFPERLLAALDAGATAGSDSRGLQSAALLVLDPGAAPLTLRVDMADRPLAALRTLYDRARSQPYAGWCEVVPTQDDPHRAPRPGEMDVVTGQTSSRA